MNFFPLELMKQMGDKFNIERDGKQIASVYGHFCSGEYPKTVQLMENVDIQNGDWLIHSPTGKRCFAEDATPLSANGEVSGWMVKYSTEDDLRKTSQQQASINIGTVSGPAIIGNQQNATMNIGASIEDIAALIATKPPAELPELCELVAELKKMEVADGAIKKGCLAKFSDALKKHSDLLVALGGWAVKLLTGN